MENNKTHNGLKEKKNRLNTKLFKKGVMDAKTVAEIGYQAMIKGDRLVVAGFGNKLQILLFKFMPRKMMTKLVKDVMSSDMI
jgi:short-subunit dehydrogenase